MWSPRSKRENGLHCKRDRSREIRTCQAGRFDGEREAAATSRRPFPHEPFPHEPLPDVPLNNSRPKTSAKPWHLLLVVLRDADLTADPGPILYDERNPQSPVVLRRILGHIEVDDDGCLTEGWLTEGLFNTQDYLWMPVLCVLAWWCLMMDTTGISSFSALG